MCGLRVPSYIQDPLPNTPASEKAIPPYSRSLSDNQSPSDFQDIFFCFPKKAEAGEFFHNAIFLPSHDEADNGRRPHQKNADSSLFPILPATA